MNKIKVGKIINTHGIKGELKILQAGIEEFDRDIIYYIGEKFTPVKSKSAKYHKGNIIAKFENFDNINDVLKFKGQDIYIDEEDLVELPEDEFYIKDIIGLDVYDQDMQKIGYLKDVLEYDVNDVYIVENDQGSLSIPAVSEFILEVNLSDKYIKVKLIEGM